MSGRGRIYWNGMFFQLFSFIFNSRWPNRGCRIRFHLTRDGNGWRETFPHKKGAPDYPVSAAVSTSSARSCTMENSWIHALPPDRLDQNDRPYQRLPGKHAELHAEGVCSVPERSLIFTGVQCTEPNARLSMMCRGFYMTRKKHSPSEYRFAPQSDSPDSS